MRRNYKIAQCHDCTFYFIVPYIDLTQEEWSCLYQRENGEYFALHQSEWSRNLRASERRQRLRLIKEYSRISINRFLDMGCGEGNVLVDAIK